MEAKRTTKIVLSNCGLKRIKNIGGILRNAHYFGLLVQCRNTGQRPFNLWRIKMINWNCSKKDADIIHKIAQRGSMLGLGTLININMDVTATHINGNPLKLEKLLMATFVDFSHDLRGINNNINRETGKLENCFSPRFSK
jgi:hypothetical protein